ncbi:hypothetical protein V2J09_003928 [Rumex salicifolius]
MGGTALEASPHKSAKKSSKKKRREPEAYTTFEEKITDDKKATERADLSENEPTMAEKLATIDFSNNKTTEVEEKLEPHRAQPPSADSVSVLLKQAIHADDRALLLDCLYNQDQKVISNSVSALSSSDTFKLLNSLLSIAQSRGAVLACALPWLRSLLLQHASKIMSQESSLAALNSLYQLIDSRVSTFSAAVQLGSSLDSLYAGATGDVTDEDEAAAPVIYNDDDDSEDDDDDEESSKEDAAMETDQEDGEEVEGSSNVSDVEGSVEMSD